MNENTKTARAEWESMSGEQQYNALVAMAWTVRRKAEARNQTGAAWIETEDDAQTVAADAWTRMGAALMVDRATISRRLYAMRDRYHAQQDNAQD